MAYETKRQRLAKLEAQLQNERFSFESHWRELGEHFAPRRVRFFAEDRNKGDKRHGKIINEHGMLAARTVLFQDSGVLDRHVPPAELHHARAERAVLGVERTRPEAVGQRVQADSARESRAGAERGGNRSSFSGSPAPATSASCDGGSSPYFTSRWR